MIIKSNKQLISQTEPGRTHSAVKKNGKEDSAMASFIYRDEDRYSSQSGTVTEWDSER